MTVVVAGAGAAWSETRPAATVAALCTTLLSDRHSRRCRRPAPGRPRRIPAKTRAGRATAGAPAPSDRRALVAEAAAITRGMTSGRKTIGRSRSRARVCMAIVASSVPSAAMPRSASSDQRRAARQVVAIPWWTKNSAKTGTATSWMSPRKMRLPVILARKIVTRSTGQSSRPSRHALVLLVGERAVEAQQGAEDEDHPEHAAGVERQGAAAGHREGVVEHDHGQHHEEEHGDHASRACAARGAGPCAPWLCTGESPIDRSTPARAQPRA